MTKRKAIPYEENHKQIEGVLYKQCRICEEWFPCNTDNFYKNKSSTKDGVSPYCKTCEKYKNYKWLKANPNKYAGYLKKTNQRPERIKQLRENTRTRQSNGKDRAWQQNNTDKIKEYRELYSNKIHKINNKEWTSCKEYFNNECAYCGLPIKEHYFKRLDEIRLGDFHKEHVDCNGTDDLSNCVPSCKRCNTSKHTESLESWYFKQTFFSQERLDKIHKWLAEDYKLYIQEHKPRKKYTRNNSIHIEDQLQINS